MKVQSFTPIFIVGNSRSGTTLMSQILRRNKDVFGFRELHFFEQIWSEQTEKIPLSMDAAVNLGAKLLNINHKGYLNQHNQSEMHVEARSMLQHLLHEELRLSRIYQEFLLYLTQKEGKSIPCEQTPRNIYYIDEILAIFPNSRFINMVRDPRDVLASQKMKWHRGRLGQKISIWETIRTWANYNPIIMSRLWKSAVCAGSRRLEKHNFYTVRFEDLLNSPNKTLQAICSFLKIEFSEKMLEVNRGGSSYMPDNSGGKGVNPDVAGRWHEKLNSVEVYFCEKINSGIMTSYKYELANAKPNFFCLLYAYVEFMFKCCLILVLNMNRYKNIIQAIKKRF